MAGLVQDPTKGTNGNGVTVGSATFSNLNSADGQITTSTAKTVINWGSFSVNVGEGITFNQPSASSIVLNRVTSTYNTSYIDGTVTSNGQVWLLNPYGVMVGSSGAVNVKGFLATTHTLSDSDFVSGAYTFQDASAQGYGYVSNEGSITTSGGYAVLAAPFASNKETGVVNADLGRVVIAGVPTYTLSFDGNGLLNFAVGSGSFGTAIANLGVINARGGQVLMTARAGAGTVGQVVNMAGHINATTARVRADGVIDLTASAGTDVSGSAVIDGGTNGLVSIGGFLTDPQSRNIGGIINVNADVVGNPGTITVLGNEIEIGTTAQAKLLASSGFLAAGGAVADAGKISIGRGLADTPYADAPRANRLLIGTSGSNFAGGPPLVELQARAFGGTGRKGGEIYLYTATDSAHPGARISTSAFIDAQASTGSQNIGGTNAQGGTVEIVTRRFEMRPGGTITTNAGFSNPSSSVAAPGGKGGNVRVAAERVEILGDHTTMPDRTLDTRILASGSLNGGTILLGGGLGGTAAVAGQPLAREIWIDTDASLRANGDLTDGRGGTIVVRTALDTDGVLVPPQLYLDGGISARGGQGGTIETVSRTLNISAPMDPGKIDSVHAGVDAGGYAVDKPNGTWLIGGNDLTVVSMQNAVAPPWRQLAFVPPSLGVDARVVSGALGSRVVASNNASLEGATDVTIADLPESNQLKVSGSIIKEVGREATLNLSAVGELVASAGVRSADTTSGRLNININAGRKIELGGAGGIITNNGDLTLTLSGDPDGPVTERGDGIYNSKYIEAGSGLVTFKSLYDGTSESQRVSIVNDNIINSAGAVTLAGGNYAVVNNLVAINSGSSRTLLKTGVNGIILNESGAQLTTSGNGAIDLIGGGGSVITNAGTISASAGNIKLEATGDTSTVRNNGSINTSGRVLLSVANWGKVENLSEGQVTAGSGVGALTLTGGFGSLIDNDGTLTTNGGSLTLSVGDSDPGQEMFAEIHNSGMIFTNGGNLGFIAGIGGTINTDGEGGTFSTVGGANNATRAVSLTVGNGGDITVGSGTTDGGALTIQGGGNATVNLIGDVDTQEGAATINVGAGSQIKVGANGSLGTGGKAITMNALGNSQIIVDGFISTTSDNATGNIQLTVGDDGNISIGSAGEITSGGTISLVGGSTAGISNFGMINSNGNAVSLFVGNSDLENEASARLFNAGSITTSGGALSLTVGLGGQIEFDSGSISTVGGVGRLSISAGTNSDTMLAGFATGSGGFSYASGDNADLRIEGANTAGQGPITIAGNAGLAFDLFGSLTTNGGAISINVGDDGYFNIGVNGKIETVNNSISLIGGIGAEIENYGTVRSGGGAISLKVGNAIVNTDDGVYSEGGLYNAGVLQTGGGSLILAAGADAYIETGQTTSTFNTSGGDASFVVGDRGYIDLDGGGATGGGNLSFTGGLGAEIYLNGHFDTIGGTGPLGRVGNIVVDASDGEIYVGSSRGSYYSYGNGSLNAGAGDVTLAAGTLKISGYSSSNIIFGDDVRLSADAISVDGKVSAANSLAIAPRTANREMRIGGYRNGDGYGYLELDYFETSYLNAPTQVFGRADGTGTIILNVSEPTPSLASFQACSISCEVPSPSSSVSSASTTIIQSGGAGGTITVRGQNSTDPDETIRLIAGSEITFEEGFHLDLLGKLEVISGGTFINDAGPAALNTDAGGQWLIYVKAPDASTIGTLASNNTAIWGVDFSEVTGSTPYTATGNRYVFGTMPTVTVTAVNRSKTYGDTLNFGNVEGVDYTVSGLVDAASFNNVFLQDKITSLSLTSTGTAANANVGSYGIVANNVLGLNGYVIQPGSGSLTVNPKQLTASLTGSTSKMYDGGTAAALSSANYSLAGFVNGEGGDVSVNQTSGGFGGKNVGTGLTVSATLAAGNFVSSSTNLSNYILPTGTIFGGIGTITRRELTASIAAAGKVYDGTTAASGTVSLSGAVAGDAIGTTTGTFAFADKNAGVGKTVNVAGVTLSGADAGNYTLVVPASTTADITPKALTASLVGSTTKTYDATTAAALTAANLSLAGFVEGEGAAAGALSGSYASPNVGTGLPVTASLGASNLTANSGTLLSNYSVPTSATGAIGAITPATLTYVANPATRPQGAPNPALSGSVTGFVGGETLATATSGTLAFTTVASLASQTGSYAINGGGLTAGNYSFVQAAGNATALTVTQAVSQPVKTVTTTIQTVVNSSVAPPPPAPPPPPVTPTRSGTTSGAPPVAPPTAGTPSTGPAPSPTGPLNGSQLPPSPPASGPPVQSTPASPVPEQAPPTPKDNADQGDTVLAAAEEPDEPEEAPQEKRQLAATEQVAPNVNVEVPTPPAPPEVPGAEEVFSGTGNPAQW